MRKIFSISVFALFMIHSVDLFAQELVYTPINPSFGGSYFNGAWLLSQAQAQDKLKDEGVIEDRFSRNPLDDFQESLSRQILSQISRKIIGDTFGENQLTEGRYELGDFIIDIVPSPEGVSITIFDITTGGETNIIVPYF